MRFWLVVSAKRKFVEERITRINVKSRMSRKLLFLIFLFLSILAYAYYYAVSSPLKISSKEAKQLLKKNKIDILLDVRTETERKSLGFYPGSVNIPASDLESKFVPNYPDKNISILAYCNIFDFKSSF